MDWHHTDNLRDLPWKQEKDPYKIWLSEIILQQTRAQQALPYYLRFIEHYPAISDMAVAPDEEVFRLWQGLGYYNRCKNMLATARYIAHDLGGRFPRTYEEIVALKGIGPYTASAIASFAFGLPHAVVDGNVYRVLSRYFGIDTPIDTAAGKAQFARLAQQLLHKGNSAAYNQAIMDLGATICKPAAPVCGDCPLKKKCFACRQDAIADLPVKEKKLQVKTRYFHYLVFQEGEKVWLKKRTGNDIWQNLYEPYLLEYDSPLDKQQLLSTQQLALLGLHPEKLAGQGSARQRLTHRIIESRFYLYNGRPEKCALPADGKWVSIKDLGTLAFPKSLVLFIKKTYF